MRSYLYLLAGLSIALGAVEARAHQYVEGTWDGIPSEYGKDWEWRVPTSCDGPPMLKIGKAPWQVVFLNFDGQKLTRGPSDSKNNSTGLLAVSSLDYPAKDFSSLGGKDKGSKAIIDELKKIFAKFAFQWVTERPKGGDYTMIMIGGTGTGTVAGGSAIGVSPVDCKNGNPNDVVFVFGNKGSISSSAKNLAFTAAHELGHSVGLEHVTDNTDIMAPALSGSTCCWTVSSVTGGSSCGRSTQDAKKILNDNVGEGKQDTKKPELWFASPGQGSIMPPDLTAVVVGADDLGINRVVVYVDGTKKAQLETEPFSLLVRNLSKGEHTLKAVAYDWLDNQAEATVTFTVDARCVVDGTCWSGTKGVGAGCTIGAECASGTCAVKDGVGVCVNTCDPKLKDPVCPSGTTCQEDGDSAYCVPGSGFTIDATEAGGGGGCRIGGLPDVTLLVLIPALGVLLQLLSRRRRQAPPGSQ